MASRTAFYNLIKPAGTDTVNIAELNENFDMIDGQMKINEENAAKILAGASAQSDGMAGKAPAPIAGDNTKYLKGDGTWADLDFSHLSQQQIADLKSALGIS